MYNGNSYSPLETLWLWRKEVWLYFVHLKYSKHICSQVWVTYLVQQECAMARHSSSVVHHCRDVAGKTDENKLHWLGHVPVFQNHLTYSLIISFNGKLCQIFSNISSMKIQLWVFGQGQHRILTLHWPPARRSQRKPWDHICSGRVLPAGGS